MAKKSKQASKKSTQSKRPRRIKESYEANPALLAEEQSSIPILTHEDWEQIESARLFHPGSEERVRWEIGNAIWAFMRMSSGYLNDKEYKAKATSLHMEIWKSVDHADKLRILNQQRHTMLTPIMEVDPEFNHGIIKSKFYEEFIIAASGLMTALSDVSKTLVQSKNGPDNGDIFWLVKTLNRIVMAHSDGGPLTQSKRGAGGNDIALVAAVIRIAAREAGRSFEESIVLKSIKNLKKTI